MKQQLASIRAQALAAMEGAQDAAALEALRVQYLGKKGELTAVLKQMGKLSAEERPAMGQLANEVRAALETALEAQAKKLEAEALEARLKAETLDVTIPGKRVELGHRHPMYHKCGGVGCPTCKGEGWIEVLGAGMIHPKVLEMSGIDPNVYSGWAFGMGLERLAMRRFKITDLRLIFENDVRFLEQF